MEYGYDLQTTSAALGEEGPGGWVEPDREIGAESIAILVREPFTPVPLADGILVETSHGDYVAKIDPRTGEEAWRRRIPGVRNGSVLGDTGFFTGGNSVEVVSLVDGSLNWRVEYEEHQPGKRVTVGNDVAYYSGGESTLKAREASTGELLWTYGSEWTPGAPAIHDGTLYVVGRETVHAVPTEPDFEDENEDVPTALPQWTRSLESLPESYHHRHSAVVDSDNNLLFVVAGGERANRLRALGTAEGQDVWEYTVEQGPITGRPTIADDTIFVGTESGVVAIDYGDEPTTVWEHPAASWVPDAPTIGAQAVYASFRSGEIRALDKASGEEKWAAFPRYMTATSPIVHDGSIYVGTENATISFSHRRQPGSALTGRWPTHKGNNGRTAMTGRSLASEPRLEWTGRYTASATNWPVLADGLAIFGGVALDAASGHPVWKARTGSDGGAFGFCTDGERVYFNAGWGLSDSAPDETGPVIEARELSSGKLIWERSAKGRPLGGPAIHDGIVYTGVEEGGIVGVDAESGEQQLFLDHPDTAWRFAIEGRKLVTGVLANSTQCWDLSTGRLLWNRRLDDATADRGAMIQGGTAYVSQAARKLYAFDMEDGRQRWEQDSAYGRAVDDRHVYATKWEQEGRIVAFGRAEGDQIWSIDTGSPTGGFLTDGESLLAVIGKQLTAFDTTDGSERWSIAMDHGATDWGAGIAVGDDGIYVDANAASYKFA